MKNLNCAGNSIRIKNIYRTNPGQEQRKRFAGVPTAIGPLPGIPLQDAEIGADFDMMMTGTIEAEVTFTAERFPGDDISVHPDTDELLDTPGTSFGRLLDHVPAAGTRKVRIRLQTV